MEGAARTVVPAFLVEFFSYLECRGIKLQHGLQGRTLLVERVDAFDIHLSEFACVELSPGHCDLQLGDGYLFQLCEGSPVYLVCHCSSPFMDVFKVSVSKAKYSLANSPMIH